MDNQKNLHSIVNDILFENQEGIILDVYYNDHGHPKYLHDLIGGSKAIELFTESLFGEIIQRNNPDKIWKVSGFGYAIEHNIYNCPEFTLDIKGIKHRILKITIEINKKYP